MFLNRTWGPKGGNIQYFPKGVYLPLGSQRPGLENAKRQYSDRCDPARTLNPMRNHGCRAHPIRGGTHTPYVRYERARVMPGRSETWDIIPPSYGVGLRGDQDKFKTK